MNLVDLFKQAKDVQAKMQTMQEQLAGIEIEGFSGAGLVRVTLNGKSELKRLAIEPSLLNPDGREMVQDLIVAAHNDAKAKLERHLAEEIGKLTRDMGLPPGMLPG